MTALQVDSDLFLTGDDLNNRLWIVGNGPGNFAVQAYDTDLNGVYSANIEFTGVTNISLTMGSGNDTVTFIRSHLEGTLRFVGGDGNDILYFGRGSQEDQTFGRIHASLGAGQDAIGATDENSFTVRQSFIVQGGDGNNGIDLEDVASVSLGHVVIIGGRDNDVVIFNKGIFTSKSLRFHGNSGYNALQWLGDATINGGVIATGRDEQDIFSMGRYATALSTITGPVLLMHGEGSNDVSFFSSTHLAGPVRYLAGSGDDEFVIYDNVLVPQSNQFVAGDIDLRLGDGNNFVSFSQIQTELQRLWVQTGVGDDDFDIINAIVQGEVLLNAGDGGNRFSVLNSEFFAPVSWTSGSGADLIYLETGYVPDDRSSFFHAALAIQLGAGDDMLWIAESYPDTVNFAGEVLFDGGDGDDLLLDYGLDNYVIPPVIVGFQ